ncbi:MAG TPA: porin [Paraburkholderia sp.]|jgi:predicted porin|nr:porin [Paraburkholderia sp.]
MKWTWGACAVGLAVLSTHAAAQSSVTIYGLLDVGVTYISNMAGHSNLQFKDGQNSPNLWGITGTEDLGGGWKTIFLLRDQLVIGTGSILPGQDLWSKSAYVGLKNDRYGIVTLGEQYDFMRDMVKDSPAEISGHVYAYPGGIFTKLAIPGNPSGSFDWSRLTGTPISNSVRYETPTWAGFHAGAMYGFGNVAGSIGAGNASSFLLSYENRGFGADAAYTTTKHIGTAGAPEVTIRNGALGSRYTWGPLFMTALITTVRNVANDTAAASYSAGGMYHFTPTWSLGLSYMYMKGNQHLGNQHANQLSGILDYALSKRTSVYTLASWQRTNHGTQANIDGLLGAGSASSGPNQAVFRIGLHTRF